MSNQYINQVVRGNDITFTTTFIDSNNSITTADGANLTIAYYANLVETTVSANMSSSDGGTTWTYKFDTANIEPGLIDWHIESIGNIKIAKDGQIEILANKANI